MSSVRQIAAEAGVSPATVSRILNNDPDVDEGTRARVLGIANRQGYAPKIGRRVNSILGIALPSTLSRDLGSFDGAIVYGASNGCRDEGHRIAIVDLASDKRPSESFTHFASRCGLRALVLRRLPGLDRTLDELARERFPHVVIADRFERPEIAWIDTDSFSPSEQAVRHLLELGHRRIAVGHYARGGADAADRVAGYRKAHEDADIKIDDALVIEMGALLDDGARLVDYALSMPDPPTALYVTHSMPSIGALRRLQQRGVRVPGEFSLVGFDDCDSRVMTHPMLTVVRQDSYDMAYRAVRWLIRSFDEPDGAPMRETVSGMFEVNLTTSIAPDVPIRVLPDGRIAIQERTSDS
ncbi:MAG: LacI family DNA-binding transcriptional regulator [Planctomycetota bacterium]